MPTSCRTTWSWRRCSKPKGCITDWSTVTATQCHSSNTTPGASSATSSTCRRWRRTPSTATSTVSFKSLTLPLLSLSLVLVPSQRTLFVLGTLKPPELLCSVHVHLVYVNVYQRLQLLPETCYLIQCLAIELHVPSQRSCVSESPPSVTWYLSENAWSKTKSIFYISFILAFMRQVYVFSTALYCPSFSSLTQRVRIHPLREPDMAALGAVRVGPEDGHAAARRRRFWGEEGHADPQVPAEHLSFDRSPSLRHAGQKSEHYSVI